MRHFSLSLGVWVAGLLLGARPAAADIPPAGACQAEEVGQTCDEAINEAGEVVGPGTCVAEQCTRASPNGAMTYDCAICRPSQPEPGAAGASQGGGSTFAGTSSKPSETPAAEREESEGCTVSPSGRRAGRGALASLLVLGLALARRRSSPARV